MLRKKITILLICAMLMVCVGGCGSGDASGTDNPYEISIGDAVIKADYNGQPYVVVEISFTNTKNRATCFNLIAQTKVYQNGIECSQILVDIGDETGIAESLQDVQPGRTYTVHPAFYLNDLTSDVEIIVYDFMELNEYTSQVMSFR